MMSLRTKLLLPVAAIVLIGVVYAIAGTAAPASWLVLLLLALLLAASAINVELLVARPLRALVRSVSELAPGGAGAVPVDSAAAGTKELAASIDRLRDRMHEYETRLAEETSRRQALQTSLRESEERYALSVERANDGTWECDLKSGAIDCSVRWKAMLQLTDQRIERLGDWHELLHPDDRATVALGLDNHINGLTPRFDQECRLRRGDGRYRWVHSRGTAIRHATGKAYRLVVMDNDIHARKELEETLIEAAEALSSVSGDDFYRALLRNLSALLGTRDNLVCYCTGDPPNRARTLAYYSNGKFWSENFEYDLAGTSCGAVIDRREIVYAPTGVGDLWPLEREYDRDSYLGVPMFDSSGKIIGHFACMDGKPMRQDLPHLALFRIFSVRAAAELERTLLREKLGAASPPP